MISLEPWGVTYEPAPNLFTAMPHGSDAPPTNAFHGLFTAAGPEERVVEIATAAGWPVARVPNGPFDVINVWIEGRQLIEFTTPELYPAYRAAFDTAGVATLDDASRARVEHQGDGRERPDLTDITDHDGIGCENSHRDGHL